MLSKKNLLKRVEIRDLTSQKINPIQGQYFGLIYFPSTEASKFAVIISKKIASKAVERNRIKRLLYRAIGNKLIERKGMFLFLAKKNCVNGKLEEFERDMENFQLKVISLSNRFSQRS